jgi:hypothetical protein
MRAGTFSSSNNWKLMTNDRTGKDFGAPGKTYIKQVYYEQQLGRAINPDRDSRPTTWGAFVEKRVFDILPISYKLVSKDRVRHPALPWSGAPDLLKGSTVCDAKCPFNLAVFCDKIDILRRGDSELYKAEYPEDYWQHISNACLLIIDGYKVDSFEAIIYAPYQSELNAIRDLAMQYNEADQYRFKWIAFTNDEELPYLIDGGNYANLNIFQFEIPTQDKIAMHDRIVMATDKIKQQSLIAA